MKLTLFVGDCDEMLASEAKKHDSSAFLIDKKNYKKIIKQNDTMLDGCITAYTSAADMPKMKADEAVFHSVLDSADKIYYYPPKKWSDADNNVDNELHSVEKITEYFLYDINVRKNNVIGLNLNKWAEKYNFLKLENLPKSEKNNLWVAGCSMTAGVGVEEHERYANIVAKSLDKNLVMLGKGGTSNEFAADQILRSNIKSKDIVIWGLTSEFRSTEWNSKNNSIKNLNPYNFDVSEKGNLESMSLETRLYKSFTCINQVINFCQKVGCFLYIFPIIPSENLILLLAQYEEFYMLPYKPSLIDKGTDNLHPGPKHHEWYAEEILKVINR